MSLRPYRIKKKNYIKYSFNIQFNETWYTFVDWFMLQVTESSLRIFIQKEVYYFYDKKHRGRCLQSTYVRARLFSAFHLSTFLASVYLGDRLFSSFQDSCHSFRCHIYMNNLRAKKVGLPSMHHCLASRTAFGRNFQTDFPVDLVVPNCVTWNYCGRFDKSWFSHWSIIKPVPLLYPTNMFLPDFHLLFVAFGLVYLSLRHTCPWLHPPNMFPLRRPPLTSSFRCMVTTSRPHESILLDTDDRTKGGYIKQWKPTHVICSAKQIFPISKM